jgi:hypothetical protein
LSCEWLSQKNCYHLDLLSEWFSLMMIIVLQLVLSSQQISETLFFALLEWHTSTKYRIIYVIVNALILLIMTIILLCNQNFVQKTSKLNARLDDNSLKILDFLELSSNSSSNHSKFQCLEIFSKNIIQYFYEEKNEILGIHKL